MKYLLIFRQQYSENTPEYGSGDYPDQIDYIAAVIEADTLRKAQNAAKKLFPRIRFVGMFSPLLIQSDAPNAALYTKPADSRLSREAIHRHRASLEALGFGSGLALYSASRSRG
jgi:hypothetical protein